jgi:tRNA(His) guanylyltransferase
MSTINLDDRMKMYEKQTLPPDGKVKASQYFIIRLDGSSFSNFTSGFVKPFDPLFVKAMCKTTADLLVKFSCKTAYTHSDEITLIFSACNESIQLNQQIHSIQPTHLFDGRIQKLLSLTAGYCSTRFNYHLVTELAKLPTHNYKETFVKKINRCEQMFDARIIIFSEESKHEIINHQIWRSVHDCERNAIYSFAHHHFGHKKINGVSCEQMKGMLESVGINWSDVPTCLKHGFYCKKKLIHKETPDGKIFTRGEVEFKTLKMEFSQEILDVILDKYWPDDFAFGSQTICIDLI